MDQKFCGLACISTPENPCDQLFGLNVVIRQIDGILTFRISVGRRHLSRAGRGALQPQRGLRDSPPQAAGHARIPHHHHRLIPADQRCVAPPLQHLHSTTPLFTSRDNYMTHGFTEVDSVTVPDNVLNTFKSTNDSDHWDFLHSIEHCWQHPHTIAISDPPSSWITPHFGYESDVSCVQPSGRRARTYVRRPSTRPSTRSRSTSTCSTPSRSRFLPYPPTSCALTLLNTFLQINALHPASDTVCPNKALKFYLYMSHASLSTSCPQAGPELCACGFRRRSAWMCWCTVSLSAPTCAS